MSRQVDSSVSIWTFSCFLFNAFTAISAFLARIKMQIYCKNVLTVISLSAVRKSRHCRNWQIPLNIFDDEIQFFLFFSACKSFIQVSVERTRSTFYCRFSLKTDCFPIFGNLISRNYQEMLLLLAKVVIQPRKSRLVSPVRISVNRLSLDDKHSLK